MIRLPCCSACVTRGLSNCQQQLILVPTKWPQETKATHTQRPIGQIHKNVTNAELHLINACEILPDSEQAKLAQISDT